MEREPKRVGYWLSEKKSKKLSIPDIEASLRSLNIEPVKIDIGKPLQLQGPFDGILHKLTDFIAQAEHGNSEADQLIRTIREYIAQNPEMIVMDSIENLRSLINRYKTYSIIDNAMSQLSDDTIFVPKFVELQSNDPATNVQLLREAHVAYPAVCKPIVAHGSSSAHQMTLVFNDQGLSEAVFPCVVQSFVNHNAVLHKLFVLGNKYFLVERPSIKNFYNSKDYAPIQFDGGEVSKSNSVSKLTVQDHSVGNNQRETLKPCPMILSGIVQEIGRAMGLNLFGVDVVIDAISGRYAIVDVNAFPGYDGVENFSEKLAEFVRDRLDDKSGIKSHFLNGEMKK